MARTKLYTKLDQYDYDLRFYNGHLMVIILTNLSGGTVASLTSEFNTNDNRIYVDGNKGIMETYETGNWHRGYCDMIIHMKETNNGTIHGSYSRTA